MVASSAARALLHQRVLEDAQRLIDCPLDGCPAVSARGVYENSGAIVSAPTLRLMLAEIDLDATMEDGLIEALQAEAESFVEDAVEKGSKIGALRNGGPNGPVSCNDVSLYLRLRRGISCGPSFAGDTRPRKRPKRD